MPPRPFSWNICCSPERPPTCGLSTYPMIAERAPHAGWTELNAEPSYCHHFIEESHKILLGRRNCGAAAKPPRTHPLVGFLLGCSRCGRAGLPRDHHSGYLFISGSGDDLLAR